METIPDPSGHDPDDIWECAQKYDEKGDYELARLLTKTAADCGSGYASLDIGARLYHGEQIDEAEPYLKKAAEHWLPTGMSLYGIVLLARSDFDTVSSEGLLWVARGLLAGCEYAAVLVAEILEIVAAEDWYKACVEAAKPPTTH